MQNVPFLAYDIVIIGSGAAGLTAALSLADTKSVCILQKESAHKGATPYAQGGIAAVLDREDSTEKHVTDTLNAGAYLCDLEAVQFAAEAGPAAVNWLIELGVPFTKEGESFHLTQEGGHSHRRIIHADDATGSAVHDVLLQHAMKHRNITLMQKQLGFEFILDPHHANKIIGVRTLDENTHTEQAVLCGAVVLATGGASHVYHYSTNPDHATGDGMAMAAKAGCTLMDLEFNQFHPTTLYHEKARSYLLTEAIRGEGGILKNQRGERFMENIHPQMELAPRDIVSRAIHKEMQITQHPCVYLDISHKDPEFVRSHFPTIYQALLKCDLDLTKDAIPVVPAAHYTCGGIQVDLNGRTMLQNVFAVGEVACTGLHGANRMASNSLLECVVFAKAASKIILAEDMKYENQTPPALPFSVDHDKEDLSVLKKIKQQVQSTMWDNVGVVRNNRGLAQAVTTLEALYTEMKRYHHTHVRSATSIEVENLSLVALLMAVSAQGRHESRGLHFNEDYPDTAPTKEHSMVKMDEMGPQFFKVLL